MAILLRQILEYPDSGSETSSETRYSYDEGEELFWEEIRRELSGDDNDGEAQGAGKKGSESGSFAKGKSREDISVIDTSKTHSWTNQSKKPRTFARKVLGKKYEQHDQQVENWIHDQVEQDQAIDKKWYSPGSPRVSASAHAFCNSYYGYQGGALLFEKEISGGIYENNVVSSHSFIDYYIFLNGRKVGMYIRDDVDNGEEESYYYLYDGQGNVVEVANKVGDLPWYLYSYFTYGDTKQVESNEGEDDLLGLYKSYDEGPFGYKTGVRHYDPETGVFISPDPFKGYMTDPASQHPYMYCHGNPIAFSDPSGYTDVCELNNEMTYIESVVENYVSETVISPGHIADGACPVAAQRLYRRLKTLKLRYYEPIIVSYSPLEMHTFIIVVRKTQMGSFEADGQKITDGYLKNKDATIFDPYLYPEHPKRTYIGFFHTVYRDKNKEDFAMNEKAYDMILPYKPTPGGGTKWFHSFE